MATVLSTTETSFVGSATDHVADLPATISDNDGILVAFFSNGSSATTHTTPSGYSLIGTGTSSNMRMSLYSKDSVASGDGGGTVNIVTSASEPGAAHVFRLQVSTFSGTVETQFGTGGFTVDNPNITPSWGSDDNLYFAIASWREGSGPITAAPSGYSTAVITDLGGAGLASCYLADTSSSEDPGAWTDTGVVQACELTVAVQPFSSEMVATVAGTSTVTGTMGGAGDLDGAIAGVATDSATLSGRGDLGGAIAGVATVTGTGNVSGTLQGEGTSAGAATNSATLSGAGDLDGTIAGVATDSATLSGLRPIRLGKLNARSVVQLSKPTSRQEILLGEIVARQTVNLGKPTARTVPG